MYSEEKMNGMQDWIDEELVNLEENSNYEKKPSVKFADGVITELEIDFSNKFEEWIDHSSGKKKCIIPVTESGSKKNWWLNKKNPIYKEIMTAYKNTKITKFKIIQIGSGENTTYKLIKNG